MNFLHWISGAAGRRDRRRREERRRLRRRRHVIDIADEGDYYDHDYDPETYWTGGTSYGNTHGYRHASPVPTAEQEPRVIFLNPDPEYVADHDHDQSTADYGYHRRYRRHHQMRRHERANSLPPDVETRSYTSYEYIPEDWYRQQYYPPIPDAEPSYEQNHQRRYLYGVRNHDHTPSSVHAQGTHDMPEIVPSRPKRTPSTSRKIDTTPIYDTDVQRALEESYAQAELDRWEERRRERHRQREIDGEFAAAEADLENKRQHCYNNELEEERRGRNRRIAELEAEVQARELQRELRCRDQDRDRDRDLDPDGRTGRGCRKDYRAASVSDLDSLAGRLDGFDLRAETRSPAPSSSSRHGWEQERYVGSLRGSSWTGQGHGAGAARGRETEPEGYYLRPRVRFSPAVSYERDFVRRPRVYHSRADLEDEEDYRYG